MSDKEKEVTKDEEKENSGRCKRGVWFAFVAQADITEQMDVVRWLRDDPRYRVVTILHDRDVYDEDGEIIRDGEKIPVKKGDTKAGHYHGIVRVGSKITAGSLCKRFGGYLHFELLSDPAEYAAYMLHATFNSRDKVRYDYSGLLDDIALWDEVSDSEREHDVCAVVSRVIAHRSEDGEISVESMLKDGDAVALRSLMAHSYFYASFVQKSKRKGE